MTQLQQSLDASGIVRHNFRINLLEGALFISSLAFVSPQIVLPALLVEMGGGNIIVGLLSVVVYAGAFLPQILAARFQVVHAAAYGPHHGGGVPLHL